MSFSILDFGAVEGGKILNTKAIQSAIDAAEEAGGGRVTVPSGVFLTGSIFLKDNVELHLEMGAVLKASERLEDYNDPNAYPENWGSEKEEWTGRHLILAIHKKNVGITGRGTVDGSGSAFFEEPHPSKSFRYTWGYGIAKAKDKVHHRPGQLAVFVECEDVFLTDLTLLDSPCWTVFLHGCERVRIRGLFIQNDRCHANTDGIDIDTCRFVTVSDCIIHTGDDALTVRASCSRLQSGKTICEHIAVSNCTFEASAMAVRIGVGSGTIRHVKISGLTVSRAASIVEFMTSYKQRGCASLFDIIVENVVADRISFPFQFIQANGALIRNVKIRTVSAKAICSTYLEATDPEGIQNVSLRDFDTEIIPNFYPIREGVAEKKGQYGFWGKGVNGLDLENVQIRIPPELSHEWKGLFHTEDCRNVSLFRCNLKEN